MKKFLGGLLCVIAFFVCAEPKEYPLNAIIQVNFEKDVATIEDAFHFLLQKTLYRFIPPPMTDPASVVMIQPISVKHRELGPMPLHRILSTLVGTDYQVVLNPDTREITVRAAPGEGD